jgi:hypothetical protein
MQTIINIFKNIFRMIENLVLIFVNLIEALHQYSCIWDYKSLKLKMKAQKEILDLVKELGGLDSISQDKEKIKKVLKEVEAWKKAGLDEWVEH